MLEELTHIPVALLCPDFDREPTGITSSIGRSALTTDSGESDGGLGGVADFLKELHGGEVGDIFGDCECSMGTGSFGVYHSLGDTLAIEVRESVDEVKVYAIRVLVMRGGEGLEGDE